MSKFMKILTYNFFQRKNKNIEMYQPEYVNKNLKLLVVTIIL